MNIRIVEGKYFLFLSILNELSLGRKVIAVTLIRKLYVINVEMIFITLVKLRV